MSDLHSSNDGEAALSEAVKFASLDEVALLVAAEARIDTALSQLILAAKGATDAASAQEFAVRELREARIAIRSAQKRIAGNHP